MSPTPRIFNRDCAETDPLWRAIDAIPPTAGDEIRVTVSNFRHDPHVTTARERVFLDHFPLGVAGFQDGLKRYVEAYVTFTGTPDFLSGVKIDQGLPKRFATVLNVNRLHLMYSWASRQFGATWLTFLRDEDKRAFETFRDYPRHLPIGRVTKNFITHRMKRRPKKFLASIGRIHRFYLPSEPFHPVWLTADSDFDACVSAPPNRLALRMCQRVGLSTDHRDNEWVCKLGFSRKNVGAVYHPAVLDGGSGYFCPAPEAFPPPAGGRAVDRVRGRGTPTGEPAREFIAMFPFISYATPSAFAQIKGRARDDFRSPRRHHLRRLYYSTKVGSPARAWVQRVRQDAL